MCNLDPYYSKHLLPTCKECVQQGVPDVHSCRDCLSWISLHHHILPGVYNINEEMRQIHKGYTVVSERGKP